MINLTAIWLTENSLSGFIPSELGLLTLVMTSLNLGRNNFSGPLPSQFARLADLIELLLSENYLNWAY
jgi:hypothetical protein